MAIELTNRRVPFRREVTVPVVYRGQRVDRGFRADLIVDGRLLVELKCVAAILPVHKAQVATYLKLMSLDRGLLINFHSRRLVDGLKSILSPLQSRVVDVLKPGGPGGHEEGLATPLGGRGGSIRGAD